MRNASISLHSNINLPRFRSTSPLLSTTRICVSQISLSLSSNSSSSYSPFHSIGRGLTLKTHLFKTNPSRNLRTPLQSSSERVQVEAKPHIVEAFGPAKTAAEMLAAFQDMEASFDDADLGLVSLTVGLQLYREGKDLEKALSFAHRALNALDRHGGHSLLVAIALHLMGCINYMSKSFDDSLGYLNRADSLLGRLEEEVVERVEDISPVKHAVQRELWLVKGAMGRIDEALQNFKEALEIIGMTLEKDGKELGIAYRDLADGYLSVSNFKEALPLSLKALKILDKEESVSPRFVAQACAEVETVYEAMDDFETAVSFLERALASLEKESQEQHTEGAIFARIGWILLLRGEVPRAIPYLESAADRLKKSFDSKHFVAGYNYNNLGVAYLESKRPQIAAEMFAIAKGILDVSRRPHHPDLIVACQNLCITYTTMGSYTLAIESQQQVIDALKIHGPSALGELENAFRIFEDLKRKARGTSSNQLPTKAMPLPRSSYAFRLP